MGEQKFHLRPLSSRLQDVETFALPSCIGWWMTYWRWFAEIPPKLLCFSSFGHEPENRRVQVNLDLFILLQNLVETTHLLNLSLILDKRSSSTQRRISLPHLLSFLLGPLGLPRVPSLFLFVERLKSVEARILLDEFHHLRPSCRRRHLLVFQQSLE